MSVSMHIHERLRAHATDAPRRTALREVASGRTLTWEQVHAAACLFAEQLSQRVAPGSVVMVRCANTCDFHIAFLGALAGGMTVFPVSHEITPSEFDAAAAKSSASAVI